MIKRTTSITKVCDVCGKETPEVKNVTMPVWFLTEQNEGTPAQQPYLDTNTFDICQDCAKKGIHIAGKGAMGYNTFLLCDLNVNYFDRNRW